MLARRHYLLDETADVIDRLRQVFPEIQGPRKDDICYATQNRQDAVREMAESVDVMIVVGLLKFIQLKPFT